MSSPRYTRFVFCFLLIFFLSKAVENVIIHFIYSLNDFVKGRCIDTVFRREFKGLNGLPVEEKCADLLRFQNLI